MTYGSASHGVPLRFPGSCPASRRGITLACRARRRRRALGLTARGGVLAVFGACFLGLLVAGWADWGELAGAVFFMASSLTAYYVRPSGLLPVVVCPPVEFLAACVLEKAITAPGALALEGTAVAMAEAAWWMLAGMALTVAIAVARGLLPQVRALWAGLCGSQA